MIEDIAADVRDLKGLLGKDAIDPRVMDALARVPRHKFVSGETQSLAYVNHALPIGHGQTISQPFIVALMTDLLALGSEDRILEVGTGSGYQTAVLAELAAHVYTVERIPALAEQARERLTSLDYGNVDVRTGDGHMGLPENAPYDGIMVTAAAQSIPSALIDQLKEGSRLVIPVGQPHDTQWLTVVKKTDAHTFHTHRILAVAFVPLL